MWNPFSPRPEFHNEQNPRIDRAIQSAAHALTMGLSEWDVIQALIRGGMVTHEVVNAVRAARVLAGVRLGQ